MLTELASVVFPSIDPVLLRLGPLAIRWYGVAYLAGFALAYMVLSRLVQSGFFHTSKAALSDLISWRVLGVMLGGRLGWWIIYHRGGAEPWYEPLAIRLSLISAFAAAVAGCATYRAKPLDVGRELTLLRGRDLAHFVIERENLGQDSRFSWVG